MKQCLNKEKSNKVVGGASGRLHCAVLQTAHRLGAKFTIAIEFKFSKAFNWDFVILLCIPVSEAIDKYNKARVKGRRRAGSFGVCRALH